MRRFLAALLFLIFSQGWGQGEVVIYMTASIVEKTNSGTFIGGWVPNRIEVEQGEKVVLRIRSLDVTHVFTLPDYNIYSPEISPGNPVEVKFTADKVGRFYYRCGMECGPYHQKMVGILVVQPK